MWSMLFKKAFYCFTVDYPHLKQSSPLVVIINAISLWAWVTLGLLGEFTLFYRPLFNGNKPLNLKQTIFFLSIIMIFEIIAVIISIRYKIRGTKLTNGVLLWPITIFLLPSFFMKWERNRRLAIIDEVMNS